MNKSLRLFFGISSYDFDAIVVKYSFNLENNAVVDIKRVIISRVVEQMDLQTLFGWESSARNKQCSIFSTLCINNGVPYVPDSKPVALNPGKSPGFPCRLKNGGL
jgi:hypothetical protein